MRPATPALRSLLDNWGPLVPQQIADLYTFTLVDGTVARYSGFQTEVLAPAPGLAGPFNYFPLGPPFKRGRVREQVGVQVDELDIEVYAGLDDLIGNLPWTYALWVGLFDGALCQLDRAFLAIPDGTAVGTVNRFYGVVDEVEIGRTKNVLKVKSLLNLLTNQMPRRLWQASCTHSFGDAMCGYDRVNGRNALGAATGAGPAVVTALAGSDQLRILTGFAPSPATLYDNGTMIGASGANAGHKRTIGQLFGGTIYYLKPLAYPLAIGDEFTLLPGCDKKLLTCTNVFQNQAAGGSSGRFGGFPYIPPPESAV